MPRQHARHKPRTSINNLQHLPCVHDLKRAHERNEFTLSEQMVIRCRSALQRALLFEKRLRQEVAAWFHRVQKRRKALTVQVIEYHDDVERAFWRRIALQVVNAPTDSATVFPPSLLGPCESFRVDFDRFDSGAAFGGRTGMASLATCQVEDGHAVRKQVLVPREPRAHRCGR